jgi:SSS family solute:Na+ symporter
LFAYWAAGKSGLRFMIAPLSTAAAAGLLMAVPAIVGGFFWRQATAAGALSSMSVGAVLVLILQLTGWKPLGMWPGVWGFIVCALLYVGVSMVTTAPVQKAESFIGYLEETLPKHNFI